MNILISGAGLAGLTAAYWLKRYGFTPTIVERAPKLLTGGYKIDVRGAALTVLQSMGIYDKVLAASTDMQGAILVDSKGGVLSEMSGDAFGHRQGDDLEITRGKLCQILMDQIPDVEIIFGDTIEDISDHANGVLVAFKENPAREFDLVIAFGPEDKFLHELGFYLCVYNVPNYLNLDRVEMQYTELGRVAAVWSVYNETNMRACFGFTSPKNSINLNDKVQQQQVLESTFKGIGWEVPKLLQLMPEASEYYFDAAAQIRMDHWAKNRVVLLGDAAYCASPLSGQGSSLALVGAYVLAGELAVSKGDYKLAFEQFEKEIQPFIKLNQDLGIKAAQRMSPENTNRLGGYLLKCLMWLAPGQLIAYFINRSTHRINQAGNAIVLKKY